MAGSTQICNGWFKNVASTPVFIPLEQQISRFSLWNLTREGVPSQGLDGVLTADRITQAMFVPDIMNSGTAKIVQNGSLSGTLAPMQDGFLAQNGFTLFNAGSPTIGPTIAITAFTPGTPTVWSTGAVSHGYQIGDIVRVFNLTSAPQFGGLAMTVTAVTATTFTTLLDSTGATTSVGSVIKIGSSYLPPLSLYYPELRVIAKITLTNPMVITTLVQQKYDIGDVVTFDIPSLFGIPQLTNSRTGLPFEATVVAVNNAVGTQTISVNVDATSFGTWVPTNSGAWPLAASYPFSFPQLVPQGEGNTNNIQAYGVLPTPLAYGNQDVLSFARQNLARNGIIIGAGDGTNASSTGGIISSTIDAWYWECLTVEQSNPF